MSTQLTVLWRQPACPIAREDVVLSFLPPVEEEDILSRYANTVVSARSLADQVRNEATETYLRVCVRIGLATDRWGRTFRSVLQRDGNTSDWWFHPLSSKDCESPRLPATLEWLMAILMIEACIRTHRADRVWLCGAPAAIVRVLRAKYPVHATRTRPDAPFGLRLHAIASRLFLMISMAQARRWLRGARAAGTRPAGPVIMLTGVWGSTVEWDDTTGTFRDRFHAGLAEALAARGVRVVRALWFFRKPAGSGKRTDWNRPFVEGHAVAPQTLVGARDTMAEALSFRTWATFLIWSRRRAFREAFRVRDLDIYPLFRVLLIYHFLGMTIPLCRLIALATARACLVDPPRATISYLEHFSVGRAHFAGVQMARMPTLSTTVQHSSVSSGTTFYHLDPRFEFEGEPDGCAVPRPEHVFVMGDLALDLFQRWGYGPRELSRTGSTRYQHVSALREEVRRRRAARGVSATRRVLIAPGLQDDVELQWIAAVCAAAKGVDGLELWIRKHPGSALDQHPQFRVLASAVQLTHGSLADDLASADLVLFSYSTLADEAFACGLPVWQWIPAGYNSCALTEVATIRRFHLVAGLRAALTAFAAQPDRWQPEAHDVARATAGLFGSADGREAERVAERLLQLVNLSRTPQSDVVSTKTAGVA